MKWSYNTTYAHDMYYMRRRWVSTMSRPFEVRYNPHTERVEVLDTVEALETLVWQLNTEMLHLTNAVKKLKGSHFEWSPLPT